MLNDDRLDPMNEHCQIFAGCRVFYVVCTGGNSRCITALQVYMIFIIVISVMCEKPPEFASSLRDIKAITVK